jgi:acyl-CoA thioesterase I
MQPSRTLAALIAAAGLGACGPSAKIDKLEPGASVLAFGDSLTYGTGAGPSDSYPAVLERAIGRKVVNAGVPGETSAEGLERLPGVLEEVKPKLLILCHGGNDFLRRLDEARARENIRGMIALARDKGIPVLLLATPKPSVPPSVPTFYMEVATDLRVPIEETVIRTVILDNRLKSDLVHPNAKGYSQIAAAVEKALRKAGAI